MSSSNLAFPTLAYSRISRVITFHALNESYAWLQRLPFASVAVDLGCGSGDTTRLLSYVAAVEQIFGLDVFDATIQRAVASNADVRIRFAVGDMSYQSTWPDEVQQEASANLITMFASLQFAKDTRSTLKTTCLALKPKGLLIGWAPQFEHPLRRVEKHISSSQSKWSQYLANHNLIDKAVIPNGPWVGEENPPALLHALLRSAGFIVHKCATESVVILLRKDDIQSGFGRLIEAYLKCIPDSLQQGFTDECYEVYTASYIHDKQLDLYRHPWSDGVLTFIAERKCGNEAVE